MLPFHGVREIINELTQCSRIESCGCGGDVHSKFLFYGKCDRCCVWDVVTAWICSWMCQTKIVCDDFYWNSNSEFVIWLLDWCGALCYVRKKCWWNQKLKKWCGRIGKLLAENWNVFFEFSMDKTKRESRKMHLNKFVN